MLLKYFILSAALLNLSPLAAATDLSTLQSALRFAQDELTVAETARDADAKLVGESEMELENLKKRLETRRLKAAQSQKNYLEVSKRFAKAQANLDMALKK